MSEPDVRPPTEGLSTLSAQFTLKAVNKIISAIKALRQKGMAEEQIVEKMARELRYFDEHSRRRIYDKSLDKPLEDDFRGELVQKFESPKKNTMILTMTASLPGIKEESLVRYAGEDYYVCQVQGLTYTLKKVV